MPPPSIAEPEGEPARVQAAPPWALTPVETLDRLGASEHGLSQREAELRLRRFGANEVEEERGTPLSVLVLRQFRSPLIYILLAAALVTLSLEEYVDAAVIAAVLAINATLGFSQEYRAQRSMEALRRLARTVARVVRDGRESELDARTLVPGDIVLLEAGARVPADGRVLSAVALEVDESLLTGESVTVAKSHVPIEADAPLAERDNMVFTGTVVTSGRCRAVVVATGAVTEVGRIASSIRRIGELETPLQQRMARFARVIGAAVLLVAALGLIAGAAAGEDLGDLFLAVVALAISAIPEGLPIVLTLVLAISVRRMASRNAVIRSLPAVETLGSCTVIGSDKTGTLTQNRMTVERILAAGRDYAVTGTGYETGGALLRDGEQVALERDEALRLTLLAGVLCNEASAVPADGEFDVRGDPTEIALLVAAAKAGLYKDELAEEWVRVAELPFDSERRYAASFNRGDGDVYAFVKGAPEALMPLCTEEIGGRELDRHAIVAAAERLAADGLRVLATACQRLELEQVEVAAPHRHLEELTFLGLVAMIDPPRDEAREAVRACQSAGIRVLMITGDHPSTGAAIARELGISGPESIAVSGNELDDADDQELETLVRENAVFARVSPEGKLRIVRALQAAGETVAVTGDGVNDAPALRAADIGTAMGRSGTDVAKEASEMVITDDNFASIVAAVEEGRVAFENVRKTTFYLVSSGFAEILAVLASIFFRFPLPFLPAQLLWLNLVTNGVQDVALAFEPGEHVLRRAPRARREGIVSHLLWERTLLAGTVMAAGTLALFLHEYRTRDDVDRARTIALTTMVLFQVFHVGNSRSEHVSAFRKSPFSNRFLFLGTAAALALHVTALHLSFTQYVLDVEPLDLATWITMLAVASSVIVAVELHKLLRRPRDLETA